MGVRLKSAQDPLDTVRARETGLVAERAHLQEFAAADEAVVDARRLAHERQAEMERPHREALTAAPTALLEGLVRL